MISRPHNTPDHASTVIKENHTVTPLRRLAVVSLVASLLLAALAAASATAEVGRYGPAEFGIHSFQSPISQDQAETEPAIQAGSHPYALTTTVEFNHEVQEEEEGCPENPNTGLNECSGEFRESGRIYGKPFHLEADLPAGLIVDPAATVRCTDAQFNKYQGNSVNCPPASTVGYVHVNLLGIGPLSTAVYNMVPPPGVPAELAFDVGNIGISAHILGRLRSGGDYGLSGVLSGITAHVAIASAKLTLWGSPSDPAHNAQRSTCGSAFPLVQRYERETYDHQVAQWVSEGQIGPPPSESYGLYKFNCPTEPTTVPFLTMPTSCPSAPLESTLAVDAWQQPGLFAEARSTSPALTGCGLLDFSPSLALRPETAASDSPTGLHVDLHVPQSESLDTRAEANLKNAVVTLPPGLAVNPSSAQGLAACTSAQIGLRPLSNERQSFSVDRPTARSFTLSFQGHTTAPLPSEASASAVGAALEALPAIGPGNVQVTGSPGGWHLEFLGALAALDVPPLTGAVSDNATQTVIVKATGGTFALELAGHGTDAEGEGEIEQEERSLNGLTVFSGVFFIGEPIEGQGIPPGTTITRVGPGELGLSKEAEATATVTVKASLPYSTGPHTLAAALQAIPAIGAGNVEVLGGPGNASGSTPYTLVFLNALGETGVPALTAVSHLTGPETGLTVTAHPPAVHPLTVTTSQASGSLRFSPEAPACPDASKIGSVEIDTPLLDQPLPGAVYLAAQGDNPFHSLLAIYVVVNDPRTGIVVKLAGQVEADPQTARLKATFEENPQLPFEDFKLDFFGGSRAPLTTPPTCGHYTTTADLTPWSAPEGEDAHPSDSFDITESPDGSPCAPSADQLPNKPHFTAGTASPIAGAYSPFVLKLSREDGSQELHALNATLPPGLTGKLAGVQECSAAQIAAATARSHEGKGALEQAHPSCPADSEVGTVNVGAGAGPNPYYVQGHAYLAGPYKGAPLSMAIVTPALAGPFDLGTVVVQAPLYVNPETAQITVKSDPIPTILAGIPLDVRSVAVNISRNQFTLNPTNCNPFQVAATAFAASSEAALASRFQVGGCNALAFKPKLSLALKGSVKRTGHPALTATLTQPPGQANIARAQVKLPKAAFLDNAHINTICTRVQFAAHTCPPGSVYGSAEATLPLLDYPLKGTVYLRSSSHELPDLVVAFNGPTSQPIEVELAGRTDSVKGALRNTFEVVPDVPVSSFSLSLFGGKRGLVEISSGFCRSPRAQVNLTAQNGKVYDTSPVVRSSCPKKHRSAHKHRSKK